MAKVSSKCPQLDEWLQSRAAPDPFNEVGAYLFGAPTLLPYRLAEGDDLPDAKVLAQAVADAAVLRRGAR